MGYVNYINFKKRKRKGESSQVNNLNSYLKKVEKEKQNKPKASRKKKIIVSKYQWNWKQIFLKTREKSITHNVLFGEKNK